MGEQAAEIIRIDSERYRRLRSFCDREHFRFVDFVESALEDALAAGTATVSLETEKEGLQKKAVKYDYAFNRGFRQGFAFLCRTPAGMPLSPDSEEGLVIVKKFPGETPQGNQLKLF